MTRWSTRAKLGLVVVLVISATAATKKAEVTVPLAWPESASRFRVHYLGDIRKPEQSIRRGFFSRALDLAFGTKNQPQFLLRPFAVAVDPRGRIAITDPASHVVHLMDEASNKHKVLQGTSRRRVLSPTAAAFDAAGDLYVTDSRLGIVFVYNREGNFRRAIGDLGKEGFFKRPNGVAIDPHSGDVYVTDTLRNKIFVVEPGGRIKREFGKSGSGPGEFNYPTGLVIAADRIFVLDALNFRVQVLALDGTYITSFGHAANEAGGFYRPKALAVDQNNRLLYVVDAMFDVVQAFTFDGQLVIAFGDGGRQPGQFLSPTGICIGPDGRLLVADSLNRRIQIFRVVDSNGREEPPARPGGLP